ncbi:MAG: bifunctional phosphopantothenoylcysteine decarboxylase/phosphopantothenate--cysteine ligase CoaBC [Magnetococcales bacterium]|nr:bifunctional phosphopantothenoylcysteine decarboxylase/phosphopantothenate--cysteine ligase CoaBC [Magnetococcales bacterium]
MPQFPEKNHSGHDCGTPAIGLKWQGFPILCKLPSIRVDPGKPIDLHHRKWIIQSRFPSWERTLNFWTGKRIVIGLGGGIGAYKTLELIRLCRLAGATVVAVPTAAALEFVTGLTLQALSGAPVRERLFAPLEPDGMDHIRLAREADLVIVAPATADLLARMAQGMADDLLTALLLAQRGPVLVAPAMNPAMWEHPATRRNVTTLQEDGIRFIGPQSGAMACGEEGLGRMAEPVMILETARRLLTPAILAGRRLVITAGPTREELDPVRFISNHSSGKMGWEVALAALRAGAEVDLVHGPVALAPPMGARMFPVGSAREMLDAVLGVWLKTPGEPLCDGAILSAAVSDYRPADRKREKIKKSGASEDMSLELTENPDILAMLSAWSGLRTREGRQRVVVGFAAETEQALAHGQQKLLRKGCDLIAINDVSAPGCGFGAETNAVTLIGREGPEESWPLLPKEQVAERLIRAVAGLLDRACAWRG